ncbi:regulatory protein GntR HTH [Pyrolobus fumarii 1A]|uniref:Regulatory protein GntR HTH n=1 Tax=Pyrolobus fumarii (strain DSM 11204 / 1A) TaxID=694429 RepID=G0ECK7_PYRF1|nr:GntR family transcriptional regulator [Pyrolobus fumarii]AEM39577.1 regulatory protein GntR HTH [Pyrolobus fumarii 1A]
MRISLSISLEDWASHALRGKKFVTVYEVARMLGVSPKTAGKILRRLESLGIVERWSRRAYRVKLEVAGVANRDVQASEAGPGHSRASSFAQAVG